jgi:uncharacterized 2Fe-2S/4Fe-4S cluster protein (DUF4445 family)
MDFINARLRPEPARTLLDLLVRQTQLLLSVCGGRGRCGKCRVRVDAGRVTPVTEKEQQVLSSSEIESGLRLACSARALTPVTVSVPQWEVMNRMTNDECGMTNRQSSIVNRNSQVGLAIDIGTTNVAVAGYDLERRKLVRQASFLNPQMSFGMDVVSRISRGKALIQDDALAPAIHRLVKSWGVRLPDIARVIAVGNTTMCHFLFRRDASPLGVYPYRSELPLRTSLTKVVRGLGPRRVTVLPLVGSYLGADTVAAVVASGMARRRELSLLLDLGTNGEIVLGNRDRLLACSTAAGPALEGANLSCGVLARDGAITDCRIRLTAHGYRLTATAVRGGGRPIGVCGSAVVKLLSELVARGLIEAGGRITGRKSILLVPAAASGTGRDILLTQADVRELQLAKAAIAAGVRILLREAGADAADIRRVVLTGLLGGRLDRAAAMRIGLLPKLKDAVITQQPNLALAGAELALLEPDRIAEFRAAAGMTREVLLGSHAEFNELFVENLGLKSWA